MKRVVQKSLFIFFSLALMLPQLAMADGMIIAPPEYWVKETDQKAVIFYDKGVETLALSITFTGDAEDFGWVVPVPEKPTVEKGSDELFTSLEELTGYQNIYSRDSFGLGTGSAPQEAAVTIIETKQIDYYDVTVLSSTDEDALIEWLQDNDYDFPSSASYILNSYIENEWFFVVMKINPQSLEWSNVTEKLRTGHATPVSISFETKNIVYPLKISSVISQKTDDDFFIVPGTNTNTNTNTNANNNTNTNTSANTNVNSNSNTDTVGQVQGVSTDRLAQVSITDFESSYYPNYYDYVDITLYVMANGKKTLPNFSTTYANWIDKESIEKLALDDQGDPLLQPSKSKYFLTKLSRSMTYSQMTEDLFFRQASNNSTIGQPIKSSGTSSVTPFFIVICVGVVLSIVLAIIILVISRKSPPSYKIQ